MYLFFLLLQFTAIKDQESGCSGWGWSRPVSNLDAGDDADGDEPEPEEDVNLFVDDVQGQDAQAVEFLEGKKQWAWVFRAFLIEFVTKSK